MYIINFVHKYKHMLFIFIYTNMNKYLLGGLERGIKVYYENQ